MKLLYKHISKEFLTKKSMLAVLSLFLIFISFMYFFVHFSVDRNLLLLNAALTEQGVLPDNQAKYLIALENNQMLIRTITLAMVGVFSLILFLYMKNVIRKGQSKIAQILALGFVAADIEKTYVMIIVGLSFVCSLIGLLFGFFGSNILMAANTQTYLVEGIVKGITLRSLVAGTIGTTFFFGVITLVAGMGMEKRDIALMMKHTDTADLRPGFVEKFIQRLPIRNKFRFKLTMKNISAFALLVIAIVTFNIMFVLSVSLIFSGTKVLESQSEGRNYAYNISFENYQTDASQYETEAIPYLKYNVLIQWKGNTLEYQVAGLERFGELFQLIDTKGKVVEVSEGIILNPELQENYGIRVGDSITLETEEAVYELPVTAVAENADVKTIYLPKKQAAELIHQDSSVFNGILTNQEIKTGSAVSFTEQITAIERSLTSNKASAVLNQSIGVITGCLLIYLATFIGLTNNLGNILVFDLLGYHQREINRILLNPYIVISNLLFLVTLPVSAYAAKRIQIMTSIQTNDYMPFQMNILTFLYMLLIINVLCFAVRGLFALKVRKIMDTEQQAEFLAEW